MVHVAISTINKFWSGILLISQLWSGIEPIPPIIYGHIIYLCINVCLENFFSSLQRVGTLLVSKYGGELIYFCNAFTERLVISLFKS